MKLENKIARGAFAAPKLYSYETPDGDTVFKGKGIDAKSRSGMGVDIIEGVLRGEGITATSLQWIRSQQAHTITNREITKHFSGRNLKRVTVVDDAGVVVAYLPLTARDIEGAIYINEELRVTVGDAEKDEVYGPIFEQYRNLYEGALSEAQVESADKFLKDYSPSGKGFNQDEIMALKPFNIRPEWDSDFMFSPAGARPTIPESLKDLAEEVGARHALINSEGFKDFTNSARPFTEIDAPEDVRKTMGHLFRKPSKAEMAGIKEREDMPEDPLVPRVVQVPTVRRWLNQEISRLRRFLYCFSYLADRIDVGEIPDYGLNTDHIDPMYELLMAKFNASQVGETLGRFRGMQMKAPLRTFENLTSWYSALEQRMEDELPINGKEEVLEKWSMERPFKGDVGLKWDVFFVNCFHGDYPKASVQTM